MLGLVIHVAIITCISEASKGTAIGEHEAARGLFSLALWPELGSGRRVCFGSPGMSWGREVAAAFCWCGHSGPWHRSDG